ncbi:MAG: I78 family peptidase inhibitor [Parvibaculum sp.]|uniref:I78 family peptidase inhibitor n=1 Tax=Parvibaculum sp. TaxID=2024848 RepID=UPI0034A047AA
MKNLPAVLALASLLIVAACDQKEEENAAEEEAVGETVGDKPPSAGTDDMRSDFEKAEAGCRAAADALAIWVARPWADARDTVTGGAVATIRVIRPGDMVTRDYRTDRLNVELDDNDVVTRVYCG